MSMIETTVPKRRRVVGDNEPAQQEPENRLAEDRTRRGWPGVSSSPYVEQSYYDQFPERFRPRFGTSGASENLTREQQQHMDVGWQKPIELITIVNCSDKEDRIALLGSQPGEVLWAIVPAAGGVVRGQLRASYLNAGIAGSKFSKYYEIGPAHAALVEPTDDRAEAARRLETIATMCTSMKTKPQRNGDLLDACMLYDCPVPGHTRRRPNGELETTLSLRHFQLLVESIGQTLTVRDEKTGDDLVLYTPELLESRKQLDKIIPLDNRPHAQAFAFGRQYALEFREMDIRQKSSEGKSMAGR